MTTADECSLPNQFRSDLQLTSTRWRAAYGSLGALIACNADPNPNDIKRDGCVSVDPSSGATYEPVTPGGVEYQYTVKTLQTVPVSSGGERLLVNGIYENATYFTWPTNVHEVVTPGK